MSKFIWFSSVFTVFIMVVLGLVSVWCDIWLGKPFASFAIILAGLISSHLISWLFKNG